MRAPASLADTWAFRLTVGLTTFASVFSFAFATLLCLKVVHRFRGLLKLCSEGLIEEVINAKFAIKALVRDDLSVVVQGAVPIDRDLRVFTSLW